LDKGLKYFLGRVPASLAPLRYAPYGSFSRGGLHL